MLRWCDPSTGSHTWPPRTDCPLLHWGTVAASAAEKLTATPSATGEAIFYWNHPLISPRSVSNGDCHLSSLQYNSLISQDISYDRDSDLYRPLFGGSCGPGYYPNNPNYPNQNNNNQGCSRIWRAQSRLSGGATRESLTARDARDCEDMCRATQRYTCRSFSFSASNYQSYRWNYRMNQKENTDRSKPLE